MQPGDDERGHLAQARRGCNAQRWPGPADSRRCSRHGFRRAGCRRHAPRAVAGWQGRAEAVPPARPACAGSAADKGCASPVRHGSGKSRREGLSRRIAPQPQEDATPCVQRVQRHEPERVIEEMGKDVGEEHRTGRRPQGAHSRARGGARLQGWARAVLDKGSLPAAGLAPSYYATAPRGSSPVGIRAAARIGCRLSSCAGSRSGGARSRRTGPRRGKPSPSRRKHRSHNARQARPNLRDRQKEGGRRRKERPARARKAPAGTRSPHGRSAWRRCRCRSRWRRTGKPQSACCAAWETSGHCASIRPAGRGAARSGRVAADLGEVARAGRGQHRPADAPEPLSSRRNAPAAPAIARRSRAVEGQPGPACEQQQGPERVIKEVQRPAPRRMGKQRPARAAMDRCRNAGV